MGELNMKAGGKWDEVKIVAESKNCFDHYTSTGWKTTGGAKIVSWESTVRKWMNNAFKFEQNQKSYGSKPKFDNVAHYQNVAAQVAANIQREREMQSNQFTTEG